MSVAERSRMLRASLVATLLSTSFLASACAVTDADLTVASTSHETTGGVPANSARLNAIGALGVRQADGSISQVCTGTLITSTVGLTAEHCLEVLPVGPS